MGKRPLNLPFLGLQALLILIDCIAVAYVSPILVSFGYSPMRIGRVMTLAALAATLARPVWGYLNDHFACARQVTLLATAAGISCYCLLVFGGDARPAVTAVAVMGLNVTIVCMMNFVDAWALRLISEGYVLNYGATRAGGSLSFALGAMVFGWAAARWGFRPGSVILWVLFILLAIVILHLPNPAPASASSVGFFTALHHDSAALAGNRAYRLMLLAFFLCTLASCAIDSFHSVLILALGGTERHVGAALFVQAICELPVMIGYTRLRDRLCASPAVLMSAAMVFYGLRALTLGFAHSLWVPLAASSLQALSFALFTPACVDFILRTVSPQRLSTAHLVFQALGSGLAAMVGNTLSGAVADAVGIHRMFSLMSLLAFLGSAFAWKAAHIPKERRVSE